MNKVSVVIVNWNGRELLSECLNALKKQSFQDFSTIVVDNGSQDGSLDLVERNFPDVECIALPRNFGFSKANNIALRGVDSEYVALLNNDAVPDKFWLEILLDSLEAHPSAGFAASKMLFYENPENIDRVGDSYTVAGAGVLRGRGESARRYERMEWVFGACAGAALYRTGMLEDIGLFDEDFFLLYEDVDLSFRAQLRDYKCLYVPQAIVYHKTSSSIVHDSPTSVYYGHRNLEWVYIKNMPRRLILRTILPHIVYDIFAFYYFAMTGNVSAFLKAKRDAVKGLRRALQKRRQIQRQRRVDEKYVWSLLEKETFVPRLNRRLRTG